MLQGAETWADDAEDSLIAALPLPLVAVPGAMVAPPGLSSARYGERRGVNLLAAVLIVLLHAAMIVLLMRARHHVHRVRETRLSVVNLLPPPQQPPAAEALPSPSPPLIVAPPPQVQVPVPPAPAIVTTPLPMPPPPPAPPAAMPAPVAAPAVSFGSNVVQGGDLGTPMVAGKPPRYPIESRRKREQGTVVLALTLGIDGAVESLVISQSSGFSRLDHAARDAVRGWRWKPTIRDGKAVRVKGVVEIPFVLRSDVGQSVADESAFGSQ